MPNTQETQDSDCDNFTVTAGESRRIWKILPDFILRKKSGTNKKTAAAPDLSLPELEGLKLTERCRDADTDTESDIKTDDRPGAGGLTTTPESKEMLTAKKSLVGCRKSWTYGDRVGSLNRQSSASGEVFDSPGIEGNLEREVRELHREHSFPGKVTSGSLSKNEARKRLLSWKRTTTARKTSEKQYQY